MSDVRVLWQPAKETVWSSSKNSNEPTSEFRAKWTAPLLFYRSKISRHTINMYLKLVQFLRQGTYVVLHRNVIESFYESPILSHIQIFTVLHFLIPRENWADTRSHINYCLKRRFCQRCPIFKTNYRDLKQLKVKLVTCIEFINFNKRLFNTNKF